MVLERFEDTKMNAVEIIYFNKIKNKDKLKSVCAYARV